MGGGSGAGKSTHGDENQPHPLSHQRDDQLLRRVLLPREARPHGGIPHAAFGTCVPHRRHREHPGHVARRDEVAAAGPQLPAQLLQHVGAEQTEEVCSHLVQGGREGRGQQVRGEGKCTRFQPGSQLPPIEHRERADAAARCPQGEELSAATCGGQQPPGEVWRGGPGHTRGWLVSFCK